MTEEETRRGVTRGMENSPSVRLIPVQSQEDILATYLNTAVGEFLCHHNLGQAIRSVSQARLLVATCIDPRIVLRIPKGYAYVLRTAGPNLRALEFQFAFALSQGVEEIALLYHDDCAMVELNAMRKTFVQGLSHFGWTESNAAEYFDTFAPNFNVDRGGEAAFIQTQASSLRRRFQGVLVAPLSYRVSDGQILQLEDAPEADSSTVPSA